MTNSAARAEQPVSRHLWAAPDPVSPTDRACAEQAGAADWAQRRAEPRVGRHDADAEVALEPGSSAAPGDLDARVGRLMDQAYLFDDPSAYRAGVQDAVQLLRSAAAHPAGRGLARR